MGNKKKFVYEALWWFIGTIIGNSVSIAGICLDSKFISIIGIIITTLATLCYAYRCWYESQWGEYD